MTHNKEQNIKYTLIGPGRLATNLAYNLKEKGWNLDKIIARSNASKDKLLKIFSKVEYQIENYNVAEQSVIFVTVKDSAIKQIAERIYKSNDELSGVAFFHFSGANDSSELKILKEKGAFIASLHPLFSFPDDLINLPSGILFTYEGDEETRQLAEKLTSDLRGTFKVIRKELKPLYHLGASMSGNLGLTMQYIASSIFIKALGEDENQYRKELYVLIRSVVDATLTNDWATVLNGPIKRGDKNTLKKHEKALESLNDAELIELYQILKRKCLQFLTE